MAVGLLPIVGQSGAAQCEYAAGEIGAIRPREDEESGVVSDQREAATALGNIPSDPFFAILEVVRRRAPREQGQPLPIHLGDISELFADEDIALEIVMFLHQLAETLPLQGIVKRDQANLNRVEDLLLGEGRHAELGTGHAVFCPSCLEMSSISSLGSGCNWVARLQKSAVFPSIGLGFKVVGSEIAL